MSKLAEKVALVTGGSRGIGAAIAKRLAADGASVAITYAKDASAASAVVEAERPLRSRRTRPTPKRSRARLKKPSRPSAGWMCW
jgi:NAD(P)-dependent dehydrogenase (short-subunit alcohol dehydrogenase family)